MLMGYPQVDRDLREYLESLGFDPSVSPIQAVPSTASRSDWATLKTTSLSCTECGLSKSRSHVVFGEGDLEAKIVFIGEGPSLDDEKAGKPFAGRSGELLTKMIEAMGLSREKVFITNIVKCRTLEDRNPESDEISTCRNILRKQLALLNPEIIVALGTIACQSLLQREEEIFKLRGEFKISTEFKRKDGSDIHIMPTFHPAFLLKNPNLKKAAWEDIQKVMLKSGLKS